MVIENNEETNVGKILRARRESLGLSIKEVSSRLKIKDSDIISLEKNDYLALKPELYLYGFVKSYATILKIDDKEVAQYLGQVPKRCNIQNKEYQLVGSDGEKIKNPDKYDFIIMLVILVMIGLLLTSFNYFKDNNTEITDLIINEFNKEEE